MKVEESVDFRLSWLEVFETGTNYGITVKVFVLVENIMFWLVAKIRFKV